VSLIHFRNEHNEFVMFLTSIAVLVQMQLLTEYFRDSRGVQYRDFLAAAVPVASIEPLHQTVLMTTRKNIASVKEQALSHTSRVNSIADVMLRVKSQV
jgi:hypothetical protein